MQTAETSQPGSTGRNLVLCSDGTGNRGGKTRGTNVWRIYQAVDNQSPEKEQLVFYEDGVGTEDFKLIKLLGGAFGLGLSENIRKLYRWLALNHEPNDQIFLFGFSRGAFTARSLAGMLKCCGLIDKKHVLASEMEHAVKKVYRCYRKKAPHDYKTKEVTVHFLGVWDTVGAVGGPPWLKHSKWSPIRYWYRFHDIHANNWTTACHALAIDDERRSFWPELLQKPGASGGDRTVNQVWFAGAHSNVGGGYPKDGLAFVSLQWMMNQAHDKGLRFTSESWAEARHRASAHDRVYDPRSGLAAYYRYSPRYPRKIHAIYRKRYGTAEAAATNVVHESVFDRIRRATSDYAPAFLFEQPKGSDELEIAETGEADELPTASPPRAQAIQSRGGDESKQEPRRLLPANGFRQFLKGDTTKIKAGLVAVHGPVGRRIGLYWILLVGTLSVVAAAISGAYFAVDPKNDPIVAPFSWLDGVLAFLSPFGIVDDLINRLARLASLNRLVSGVTILVLLGTTLSLVIWRQGIRKKATRLALDAWQGLRRPDLGSSEGESA